SGIPLLSKEGKFAKRTGWLVKLRSHLRNARAVHRLEDGGFAASVRWLRDFTNHPGAYAPPLLGKEGNVHGHSHQVMKRLVITSTFLLTLAGVSSRQVDAQQGQQPAAAQHRALVNQYCVTCHNEKLKTGDLMLDKLDLDRVGTQAETWEKVTRKLRA